MTDDEYGPNTVDVRELVERAGRLTVSEATALVAAYGAARVAARVAAYGAALGAARGAALDAALVAALDAAYGAAYGAALDAALDAAYDAAYGAALGAADAARAIVVRDLIDETTTWNQAAYDLLTQPWRDTIGPLPGDTMNDDTAETENPKDEPTEATIEPPKVMERPPRPTGHQLETSLHCPKCVTTLTGVLTGLTDGSFMVDQALQQTQAAFSAAHTHL